MILEERKANSFNINITLPATRNFFQRRHRRFFLDLCNVLIFNARS